MEGVFGSCREEEIKIVNLCVPYGTFTMQKYKQNNGKNIEIAKREFVVCRSIWSLSYENHFVFGSNTRVGLFLI